MSNLSVTDLSADFHELTDNFECESHTLILGIVTLPEYFISSNKYIHTLDMSRCTNLTYIEFAFCNASSVQNIIWPPNIINIRERSVSSCERLQRVDLSYCTQLVSIDCDFCSFRTNIVELILPISIQKIQYHFLRANKTLKYLDLRYCTNLTFIGSEFCTGTNIQCIRFPRSLKKICGGICHDAAEVQELDFELCGDADISLSGLCNVETLKLHNIDSIYSEYDIGSEPGSDTDFYPDIINVTDDISESFIYCKNLHIYNIKSIREIDLSYFKGLQNVYLPEGEYCITGISSNDHINFWLGDTMCPADHFLNMRIHTHSYLPVSELATIDISLNTI
jgi:hypothetical protein